MKVIVEINESEIKDIERLIASGKISSLSTFVSLSLRNQITIEETKSEIPQLESKIKIINSVPKPSLQDRNLSNIEVPTVKNTKIEDKFPFWGTQNKYLCLKQITRDFVLLAHKEGSKWVRYDIVMNELLKNAMATRHSFEMIDKQHHRGRGEKLSTGFPKNDSKSASRYEKQFIGGIDGSGNKYGLAVEIGFLDVRVNNVNKVEFALTELGLEFSKLNSPVFGKQLSELAPSTPSFSEEERLFLLKLMAERKPSEINLMLMTLKYIEAGKNKPSDGASITKEYLDDKYPELSKTKKGGSFSMNEAETIRAGVISRLNELNLLSIEKKGLRSIYKVTKSGKHFINKRRI